jgi:hypothetical protein
MARKGCVAFAFQVDANGRRYYSASGSARKLISLQTNQAIQLELGKPTSYYSR